jgi:hypothetical protein
MLDLIGATAGMAAVLMIAVGIADALQLSTSQRLAFAGGVGAWLGLATGLAAAGAFAFTPDQPIPLVGVFFAAPLLGAASAWFASATFREALLAIPMPLLIGLNGTRVLGALFLILAAAGRLSGPFPFSAGWGDIITGTLAIPVAIYAARAPLRSGTVVAAWNLVGTLDLFSAVGLGLISAQGSPLQLIHAGVGSEAMQQLPYSLVPTVLVPAYLIMHGIIAAQLASRAGVVGARV